MTPVMPVMQKKMTLNDDLPMDSSTNVMLQRQMVLMMQVMPTPMQAVTNISE